MQPLTPELKKTGKRIVCTDATGAGAGELVYWCRGKESSFPFLPTEVPTDTTIVGHRGFAYRTSSGPARTKKGKR